MNRLVKKKKLNEVLKNSTELEITTGSAALGRGSDFQTLTTFVATLTQITQAQGAGGLIDLPELIKRLAYSLDINTAQLVKSQDQIAEEQAAASQAQAVQEAAPKVIAQNNEAQLQQE
jgi:Xaa-Pro aminopeptidase